MNEADISEALTDRLRAAALGYPIAYENADASPARPYLQVQNVRVTRRDRAIAGSREEARGYLMVTVVGLTNEFASPAERVGAEVMAVFPYATRITFTGGTITITKPPEMGPGFKDNSDFRVPVRIDYHAQG